MKTPFDFARFDNLLLEATEAYSQSAICTKDGVPLHIRFLNLADIGTLPRAAEETQKYLNLKPGEVAICNDPYSGGSTLSSMTLVMAAQVCTKKSEPVLLCLRVPFKPRVPLTKSIDEEGIRIPPTPILMNGQINNEILEAMSQHPLCPVHFKSTIVDKIESLQKLSTTLKHHSDVFGFDWSKSSLKKYLSFSQKKFKSFFANMSEGESTIECSLENSESIRLKTISNGEKVVFDFTGTTSSKNISLTDSATLGACVGPLLTLFDQLVPINQGLFECIDLVAPEGTLVNSTYPHPVFQGMTDGTTIVANLVTRTIGVIDEQRKMAVHGYSLCSFELDFGTSYFFETVEPGTAANAQFHGQSGVSLWKRNNLNPRIEEIEKIFPVEVVSYTIRSNSGGSGLKKGGDGISKSIKILKDAQFKWSINEPYEHPQGNEGGKMAYPADVHVLDEQGQKNELDKQGELHIKAGSTIVISSSGGGGFGLV